MRLGGRVADQPVSIKSNNKKNCIKTLEKSTNLLRNIWWNVIRTVAILKISIHFEEAPIISNFSIIFFLVLKLDKKKQQRQQNNWF